MGRSRKPLWALCPPRVRIPPFPPDETAFFVMRFLFAYDFLSDINFWVIINFRVFSRMTYNLTMEFPLLSINGETKAAVAPNAFDELKQAMAILGLKTEQPVIVVVGGAGGMNQDDIDKVQQFLEEYLVPFASERKAAIVDGGTDSGVMAAIGRARHKAGAEFPLVGVLARDVDNVLNILEPNHTHFVLCPGANWGDESEWIPVTARTLAGNNPSAAILINGGKIAWRDAEYSVKHGQPVLIAEGSGRTADVIATTSTGMQFDKQAIALLRTGMVHVANFFKDPAKFIEKLGNLMH